MDFEFATATRIIFGEGKAKEIGPLAAEMGWRALVVMGVNLERTQPILGLLASAGVVATLYMVEKEPTIQSIQDGLELARREQCDMVIGFGGGSAIDTGKAIAALLNNPGQALDYLEVIGRGQKLITAPVPFIAIPTTAGTGAEVTRNAVLGSPDHHVKVSLRSPLMLPRLAVVDPELTYSLPPDITASTGLDALTQVLEPYVSIFANPLTDAICREGMMRAARSLRTAVQDGDNVQARRDMSLASLFGGLALANAKLGAVHGFAGPFGGMFMAPHGAVCAALLPHVVTVNLRVLRERLPDSPALVRYEQAARLLTADPAARAEEAAAWLQSICADLEIPSLSHYGLTSDDFPLLIEKAQRASSMKGNPIELTPAELEEILQLAL